MPAAQPDGGCSGAIQIRLMLATSAKMTAPSNRPPKVKILELVDGPDRADVVPVDVHHVEAIAYVPGWRRQGCIRRRWRQAHRSCRSLYDARVRVESFDRSTGV